MNHFHFSNQNKTDKLRRLHWTNIIVAYSDKAT